MCNIKKKITCLSIVINAPQFLLYEIAEILICKTFTWGKCIDSISFYVVQEEAILFCYLTVRHMYWYLLDRISQNLMCKILAIRNCI